MRKHSKMSRRLLSMLLAAVFSAACCTGIVGAAADEGEKTVTFEEQHILVRFGLVSDLHISKNPGGLDNQRKFAASMKKFVELAGGKEQLPLTVIPGDLIDWDGLDDIEYVRQAVEEALDPAYTKLLITPGNHDAWCTKAGEGSSYYNKTVFQDYNLFRDYLPAYMDYPSPLDEKERIRGFEHLTVNGVHFLSVVGVDGAHGSESVAWLRSQLNDLREQGNKLPVFVVTHVPPSNTVVATTDNNTSSRWHSISLRNLLFDYPEAVVLAGHTHAPLDSPNNVWQGAFTAINCGSLHLDADDAKSACAFVEVDQNGIIRYTRFMFRPDFSLEQLSGDPQIIGRPAELGDANGDGEVGLTDTLLVLRHAAGGEKLDKAAIERCDLDGDGRLSNIDAARIAKKLKKE